MNKLFQFLKLIEENGISLVAKIIFLNICQIWKIKLCKKNPLKNLTRSRRGGGGHSTQMTLCTVRRAKIKKNTETKKFFFVGRNFNI